MPAGVADTPWALPFQLLVIELALCEPENEIRFIALISVLLNALADTYGKVLLLEIVEHVVLIQL